MTVLGNNSKPTNTYQAYDGSGYPNQMVEKLTTPAQRIQVNSLGAWIGGWNAAPHCILGLWALDGTLLGSSAEFVVANEGAAGAGQISQYERALTSPVVIAPNTDVYVGSARNRSEAAQWGLGATSSPHFEATGAYPGGDLGSISGPSSVARRMGQYIADYQPISAAWVRRSGVWVQASDALVYRGGAWVTVDGIEVLRGTTWEDAG